MAWSPASRVTPGPDPARMGVYVVGGESTPARQVDNDRCALKAFRPYPTRRSRCTKRVVGAARFECVSPCEPDVRRVTAETGSHHSRDADLSFDSHGAILYLRAALLTAIVVP